jgi:hypothetical protein
MCSYETIFNSFGKLVGSYGVRNPMDLWWQACLGNLQALVGQTSINFFGRHDLAYG